MVTLLTKARELEEMGAVLEELRMVALQGLHVLDLPEDILPDHLLAVVAGVCLNLANNCNTGTTMDTVAKYIVTHPRWRVLPQNIREDSMVMLLEQLIVTDRIAEAKDRLSSFSGGQDSKPGIELQFLRGFLQGTDVYGTKATYDATEEEKETARELFHRIENSFNDKPEELKELLNFVVAFGLYQSQQQRPHFYAGWLKARPVWSLDMLGEVGKELADLQLQWRVLRREAMDLVQHYNWTKGMEGWIYSKDKLDKDGGWKQLVFSGSGKKRLPGDLCSVVPTLCSVANKFPGALSCRDGRMKIAVLEGKSHVKPHFGVTNTKLRVNLPLVVPQDASSYLRIGDVTEQLQEGKIVVFDDSFEHEAWNTSPTGVRVVLLVDINHPDLSMEDAKKYEDRLREITEDFDGPNYDDREEEQENDNHHNDGILREEL